MSVLDCRSLLLVVVIIIICLRTYALLIVVGVSFNQSSSYSVNETSNQVEIVLVLSSPLSFDVTATIDLDNYGNAVSKLIVYYTKWCTTVNIALVKLY